MTADLDGFDLAILAILQHNNLTPQREIAERLHPQGVRRLLGIALADKCKQARKQLPVQPKISLLYAAIESAAPRKDGLKDSDRLRADLVDGAFAALSANGLLDVRDAAAFAQCCDAIGKGVFAEAMQRLNKPTPFWA